MENKKIIVFGLAMSLLAPTFRVYAKKTDEEKLHDLLSSRMKLLFSDYFTWKDKLYDGEALGYPKPEVSLTAKFDEQTMPDYTDELKDIDATKLSDTDRFIYDLLVYETGYSGELVQYTFGYENPVASCSQFFVLFEFRNKDDFYDYITLVKDADNYFDKALSESEKDIEEGKGETSSSIKAALEEIDTVFDVKDTSPILSHYKNNISTSSYFTPEEKASLISELTSALQDEFYPSVANVKERLETLLPKARKDALYTKEQYLDQLYGLGIDMDPASYIRLLKNYIELEKQYIRSHSATLQDELHPLYTDAKDVIQNAKDKLKENNLPQIDDMKFTVSNIEKGSMSDTLAGYYVIPPFGVNDQEAKLAINYDADVEQLELIDAMQHEGIPGHMYQWSLFMNSPYYSLERTMFMYAAYAEGWATYSESLSAGWNYPKEENETATANIKLTNLPAATIVYLEALYYINGESEEEIKKLIKEYYNAESENQVQGVYDVILKYPLIYTPYVAGSAYISALYTQAEEAMQDDFDALAFHEAILDKGDRPFTMVFASVNAWAEEKGYTLEENFETIKQPVSHTNQILALCALGIVFGVCVLLWMEKKKKNKA